ncbi:MAG: helix-turn-helix domain-containing protein [Lachnospiraceae bacterium]|nr:helix-turn-helix domain-containing protein [Lachnospiraceae bacterium]
MEVLEFHEKLQELRKSRGLTQEELAGALFVSRTAISKWESGRGYPSIDSLKEISRYFSVSIDDLLSGEQLIFIAEKENKSNLNSVCDLLLGFVDLFSLMLIFLPLYPKLVNGYIYSVNLFGYVGNNTFIIKIYWALFISLTITGIVKILMVYFKFEKDKKAVTFISVGLSIIAVLFLAMAREPYAITVTFLLLLIKGILLYKQAKAG